jgi:DNA-binding MurR/RpiR family transcriptional regulator
MSENTPNDVIQQIEKHYDHLSPSSKSIAHYLQKNPIAVISQSTSTIAEKTNTSKATVSRFFRQLGFESHQQAKDAIITLREQGVPVLPPE